LICGLGNGSYAIRRLRVSDEIAHDQEQLQWELSRGLTEEFDHYHQSTLHLATYELMVLTAKRRAVRQLGMKLASLGLTLEHLTFEPEALFHACRSLAGEGRTLILLVEPERAQLLLLFRRQLVISNTLSLRRNEAHALLTLAEDIGTVLLATPFGRTVDRRIDLILAGDPRASGLADALERTLPYEFNQLQLEPEHYNLACSDQLTTEFAHWFLPVSLALRFYEERVCTSSPANDVASS